MLNIVRFKSSEDGQNGTVEGAPCGTLHPISGPAATSQSNLARFPSFELDLDSCQLRKHGSRVRLRSQSFQVLTCLLEHRGRVVSREDLRRRLWNDGVFVDFDNGLNTVVARLRQVLGDSFEHPSFIETVPKRGYRFIADVDLPAPGSDAPVHRAKLLVLPFLHRSGNPLEQYVSDALTDDLITTLASLAPESLGVIARAAATHYRENVVGISGELNVDYVVEGQVRCSEDRVVINVRLAQASDQTCLYARRFHAEVTDLRALQESVARDIAERIPCLPDGVPQRTESERPNLR